MESKIEIIECSNLKELQQRIRQFVDHHVYLIIVDRISYSAAISDEAQIYMACIHYTKCNK